MVKDTQTKFPTNCLSVFDHFVGLALKGIMATSVFYISSCLSNTNIVIIKLTYFESMLC